MIWQIITDFLKLLSDKEKKKKEKKINALLSLFLTAYHYSRVYFSQPKIPKPVP